MGYPPFYGEDPTTTCKKVMNFKKYLEFPDNIKVSREAIDLLKRLITSSDKRLGKNGIEEIKRHPWFRGINWKNILNRKAPIIPKLSNATDTSNFDHFEEISKWHEDFNQNHHRRKRRRYRDYFWIGYTFKKQRNIEAEQDIKEIFEILKKKKEMQGKRMFSEEKITGLKKNRLGFKYLNKDSNHHFGKNQGYNFKKKKQQKEIFETNKKIFESIHNSDRKNLNFLKKYNFKKRDKRDKKGGMKSKKYIEFNLKPKKKKPLAKRSKKTKLNISKKLLSNKMTFDIKPKLKKLQNKLGISPITSKNSKSKNGILKKNNPYSYLTKNNHNLRKIDTTPFKLNKKLQKLRLEINNHKRIS